MSAMSNATAATPSQTELKTVASTCNRRSPGSKRKPTAVEMEIALLERILGCEREAVAAADSAFGRSWRSVRPRASIISRRHTHRVDQLTKMLNKRWDAPLTRYRANQMDGRTASRDADCINALRHSRGTEFGNLFTQFMQDHLSELTAYQFLSGRSNINPEISDLLRHTIQDDEFDLRNLEQVTR